MDLSVIERKEEVENGWRFIVEIGVQEEYKVGFAVLIDREYWKELTLEKFPPEQLLKETFRFLFAKEMTKIGIARELGNLFDLRKDLPSHYSSYERRIKMALFGTEYPKS